jgi:hypothetical protein
MVIEARRWKTANMVKCFGCGLGPIGPVDLAIDVLGVTLSGVAQWFEQHFDVPLIPRESS